jgi:hypothetical protein
MQNEFNTGNINANPFTSYFDSNRANDSCMDTFTNTTRDQESNNINDKNNNNNSVNIYRYKFTIEFMDELFKFAKVHQYDHRSDFKEAWEQWLENNDNLISSEIKRLTDLEYEGDILDKMYKSARYYFRKKSTEKKEPTQRCKYTSISKNLIMAMDNDIKSEMNNTEYKPSEGFIKFCKNNIDLLKENISILCQNGLKDSEEIKNKFKKTYKNRYFLLTNK